MNTKTNILIATIVVLFWAAVGRANVVLPDVIGDAMVLQRDRPVPIWGHADAGETVTVRFAGQFKKTSAGANGQWRVQLDPLHTNAVAATMTISGKNTIELKNILVGEVWLVAGQSNMQRLLSETANGAAAAAAANHPLIRLFNVSRQVAFKHAHSPLATWQGCSPQTIKEFSAAGYYFGVELEKELRVPIGLINSSYGGAQAGASTPGDLFFSSLDLPPPGVGAKNLGAERPQTPP